MLNLWVKQGRGNLTCIKSKNISVPSHEMNKMKRQNLKNEGNESEFPALRDLDSCHRFKQMME